MLLAHKQFDEDLFEQLFSRPSFFGTGKFPSLFLSDQNLLLDSIAHDFPDIVSLSSIGDSF
jgi:hypothetical protein